MIVFLLESKHKMDEGCSLLTSTRYDPFLKSCRWNDDYEGPQPFFLLPYHLERLISAAEAHGWSNIRSALTYSVLKNACAEVVSTQQSRGEKGFTAFKVYSSISLHPITLIPMSTGSDNCLKRRAELCQCHCSCNSILLVRSHIALVIRPIVQS